MSRDPQHAANIVRFALRVSEVASTISRPDVDDGSTLQLRIGEECLLPPLIDPFTMLIVTHLAGLAEGVTNVLTTRVLTPSANDTLQPPIYLSYRQQIS